MRTVHHHTTPPPWPGCSTTDLPSRHAFVFYFWRMRGGKKEANGVHLADRDEGDAVLSSRLFFQQKALQPPRSLRSPSCFPSRRPLIQSSALVQQSHAYGPCFNRQRACHIAQQKSIGLGCCAHFSSHQPFSSPSSLRQTPSKHCSGTGVLRSWIRALERLRTSPATGYRRTLWESTITHLGP